jgi:hypothetical protein
MPRGSAGWSPPRHRYPVIVTTKSPCIQVLSFGLATEPIAPRNSPLPLVMGQGFGYHVRDRVFDDVDRLRQVGGRWQREGVGGRRARTLLGACTGGVGRQGLAGTVAVPQAENTTVSAVMKREHDAPDVRPR